MTNQNEVVLDQILYDFAVWVRTRKDEGISHDEARQQILEAIQRAREEVLDQIEPFSLVEDCNPDCTPEEHAYHQGTWDSYLKLERTLEDLKKGQTEQK